MKKVPRRVDSNFLKKYRYNNDDTNKLQHSQSNNKADPNEI